MKDWFTRGFISGIIAGAPTFAYALLASLLKWTTFRWVHFTAVLIYGRRYINFLENAFATLITFFFCGLMGVVFAFIVSRISNRNYLLKGWVFSTTIWFLAFAIINLLRMPEFTLIPLKTAVSNFVEASIWGLLIGYCLRWFEYRITV
jgi:hypothetical protein